MAPSWNLDDFPEHMRSSADVRLEPLRDVAARFREENPLEDRAKDNPHRTGATARNAPKTATS